jgi:TonB family protein
VNSDDYPPDALRAKEQGVTAFRLAVDTAGAVSGCEVVASSGSKALDETACQMLSERARFTPAMDKDGHVVPGSYRSRVRWALPASVGHPMPGVKVERAIVEKDGSMSNCEVTMATGFEADLAKVGPKPCSPHALLEPYFDAKGEAVRKRVIYTGTITIEDVPN